MLHKWFLIPVDYFVQYIIVMVGVHMGYLSTMFEQLFPPYVGTPVSRLKLVPHFSEALNSGSTN